MVFNSALFFLTLIPVLAWHFLLCRSRPTLCKYGILLYSFVFYGLWNPYFLILLLGSTYIDYQSALWMERYPARKKTYLLFSIISNIGTLAVFKYYNFSVLTAGSLFKLAGVPWHAPTLDIVLPVGLSFYVFEALSYTIDVYRGILTPRRAFLDVALFVAYFPHLVAGPIVRARDLMPQFERGPRISRGNLADGVLLVVVGLFLKCVVADNAAHRVNELFAHWYHNSVPQNWAAAMLFGVQVYGDFAGYSAVAVGIARMMGYFIPFNFNFPYGSAGFSDFWRRWHISLSSWLRDYLYIPLGGNRKGAVRTYCNLMATMLLGGLWHGASWMFVLWGAMHGAYLCAERLFREKLKGTAILKLLDGPLAAVTIVLTFVTVSVTWIPFRATHIRQCLTMIRGLAFAPLHAYPGMAIDFAVIAAVFLFDWHWARRRLLTYVARRPWVRSGVIACALVVLWFFTGQKNAFIYFQF